MNIAGFTMSSPWASRSLWSGYPTEEYSDIPCLMRVSMDSVFFTYDAEVTNYRPRLHMRGKLMSIIPSVEMPLNINEITFDPESGPAINGFYNFDDDQLAVLVSKGYFSENFNIPELLSESVWELPVEIDALLVLGDPETDIVPAIFVDIHDQLSVSIDMNNSGYDLANVFNNIREHEFSEVEQPHSKSYENEFITSGSDLFANEFTDDNDFENDDYSREQMVAAGLVDDVTGKLTDRANRFQELLDRYRSDEIDNDDDLEVEEISEDEFDDLYNSMSESIKDSLRAAKIASVVNDSNDSFDLDVSDLDSKDSDELSVLKSKVETELDNKAVKKNIPAPQQIVSDKQADIEIDAPDEHIFEGEEMDLG